MPGPCPCPPCRGPLVFQLSMVQCLRINRLNIPWARFPLFTQLRYQFTYFVFPRPSQFGQDSITPLRPSERCCFSPPHILPLCRLSEIRKARDPYFTFCKRDLKKYILTTKIKKTPCPTLPSNISRLSSSMRGKSPPPPGSIRTPPCAPFQPLY